MQNSPDRHNEWYVSLPLSDLNKLRMDVDALDTLRRDNAQLRRELDGLRNMYNDLLVVFGELRRELKGR